MPGERLATTSEETMVEMLEQYLSCSSLQRGQIVSGTVVHASRSAVVVDINAKCEGVVPEYDLEKLPPDDRSALRVGGEVLVFVVNPEDANGNIVLSLSRAQSAHDWVESRRLLESQEIVELKVASCNKGGLIVYVGKLRGFVPGSHLSASRVASRSENSPGNEDRWTASVGETIRLKVIEVDQKRNRLILSERAALRDWRRNQRQKLLEELAEGDVYRGRVINLVDFGAFVDLGGIDGLVHLSELSWRRVSHPREAVEVGQEVEVYVLGVDRERQRVALSLKRLQPDPWESIEERYQEGQLVQGKITRITKWGAFASIVGDEAIEGLIHISELDEGPVVHPRDVIQPGQTVTLRVLGANADRHRLALSLKQAAGEGSDDGDWHAALAAEQPALEGALSAALAEVVDIPEDRRSGQVESQTA